MIDDLKPILAALADGKTLSEQEAVDAFDLLMAGEADLAQTAAFLMALRLRGETIDEITAGAKSLRSKALMLSAPDGTVDTCGTGGDGLKTLNISTAAALVAAAAGATVAKHGNRSVSSKSGSSDVLLALGANLDIPVDAHQEALKQFGYSFLFAPKHHAAVRHVAPARASLGLRTVFNLLGPLANPSGTKRQVLGVFDHKWLRPMAEVMKRLGSEHVMVVHGADGLDEISISGPTFVAELKDGAVTEYQIDPESVGLSPYPLSDIVGGDTQHNAGAIMALLEGRKDAYRDIVAFNAGAALYVGGTVSTIQDGIHKATDAIDTGAGLRLLENWIDFTQQHAQPGDAS